ncbi:MAG: PQQ-dependent sugar dehydrogenase, partial [Acidimicrobiales bacterium]
RLVPEPVARVDVVSEPGQRGLLGVAVDAQDNTYAAWTRADDGRLVVGQVAPGTMRLLWLGPPSTDLANGGHLVVGPDGRLVVGIGDLQDRARLDDPDAPNGKILSLDPAGRPDQRPRSLSSGWNNPFAFTFLPDGSLWVADNAPGEAPERIGRGDGDGRPRLPLPAKRAPSVLVALGPGRLGLCGFLDGVLREVLVDRDQAEDPGPPVVGSCSVSAARLADGRLALAGEESITSFEP